MKTKRRAAAADTAQDALALVHWAMLLQKEKA